jgi:hypothetical protein
MVLVTGEETRSEIVAALNPPCDLGSSSVEEAAGFDVPRPNSASTQRTTDGDGEATRPSFSPSARKTTEDEAGDWSDRADEEGMAWRGCQGVTWSGMKGLSRGHLICPAGAWAGFSWYLLVIYFLNIVRRMLLLLLNIVRLIVELTD